jgi:hypothetical protein
MIGPWAEVFFTNVVEPDDNSTGRGPLLLVRRQSGWGWTDKFFWTGRADVRPTGARNDCA